jgi:predicted AAA+ superfamily ATPase
VKVTVITGPMKSGKSTAATQLMLKLARTTEDSSDALYVTFEDDAYTVQERLSRNFTVLECPDARGLVEHRIPRSLLVLDRPDLGGKGWSQARALVKQSKADHTIVVLGTDPRLVQSMNAHEVIHCVYPNQARPARYRSRREPVA